MALNFALCLCVQEIENFLSPTERCAPVYVKMQLNVKFHAIPSINFCASAVINLVPHKDRPTDKNFVKIVFSCLGLYKTCKSIKNRNSKIFTVPILSYYSEYTRK